MLHVDEYLRERTGRVFAGDGEASPTLENDETHV
jgi:hypothetical protein